MSYVKYLDVLTKLCFVTHVTLMTHNPSVTRNTHVFYEIKKPNKIGGLIVVAPRECYSVILSNSVTLGRLRLLCAIYIWVFRL